MKKLLAILLSLVSVICIAFSFAGCAENQTDGQQDELNDSENQTDGQDKGDGADKEVGDDIIEEGNLFTVTEAYDKGYLTREQVMSIAYYHNEEYDFVSDYYYQSGKVSNEEIRNENYTPIPVTPEKLSTDTENSIKQAYLDLYYKGKAYAELSGVRIDSYYGTFDGCVAVMITDSYSETTAALRVEEVAGIGICYNNGNRILIWISMENELSGWFYSLENAYSDGLLNKDDLKAIAAVYNGEAQCTDTIEEQTELLIKICLVDKLKKEYNIAEAEIKGTEIVKFYGKYNDCFIITTDNIYVGYPTDVVNEWFYIDGVAFHKTDRLGITVWVRNASVVTGTFYTATEAYEKGYLTREQVMSIAYYHNDGTEHNEEIMDKDYTPLPKNPETLSVAMERALINSFYTSNLWKGYANYYTKNDISYGYFGTYGNCVAVRIGVRGGAVGDAIFEEIIDGVTIYCSTYQRILIWIYQ